MWELPRLNIIPIGSEPANLTVSYGVAIVALHHWEKWFQGILLQFQELIQQIDDGSVVVYFWHIGYASSWKWKPVYHVAYKMTLGFQWFVPILLWLETSQIRSFVPLLFDSKAQWLIADIQYASSRRDTTQLLNLEQMWKTKYPIVVRSWLNNWERLATYFEFPLAIRKAIYTNNPIESYHRQIRKHTKSKVDATRGCFRRIRQCSNWFICYHVILWLSGVCQCITGH